MGYGCVALTDVNSLGGCVEFADACQRAGVRPIIGARLTHLSRRATVLVSEPIGWRNLCAIVSRCQLDGKADLLETLSLCAAGLHVLVDQPQGLSPAIL